MRRLLLLLLVCGCRGGAADQPFDPVPDEPHYKRWGPAADQLTTPTQRPRPGEAREIAADESYRYEQSRR